MIPPTRLSLSAPASFECQLGQHENAVQSFRKALAPGSDEVHRSLIARDGQREEATRRDRGGSPPLPRRLPAPRRPLRAARPRRPRPPPRPKNTALALAIAEEVLLHDVTSHDFPRAYVDLVRRRPSPRRAGPAQGDRQESRRCREAPRRAGPRCLSRPHQGHRQGPRDGPRVSRQVARRRRLVRGGHQVSLRFRARATRPSARTSNGSPPAPALSPNSPDSRTGSGTPRRPTRTATATGRPRSETIRTTRIAKLWRQTREDGGKSGQACQATAPEEPVAASNRLHLLARLAYVYRHHLGGKSQGGLRQALRNALPRASPTISTPPPAGSRPPACAGRDMQLAAARHLLTLPPADCPSRHLGPPLRNEGRSHHPQGHPVDHRLVEREHLPAQPLLPHRRPHERARDEGRSRRLVALADGSEPRRLAKRCPAPSAWPATLEPGAGRRVPATPLRSRHRLPGRLRRRRSPTSPSAPADFAAMEAVLTKSARPRRPSLRSAPGAWASGRPAAGWKRPATPRTGRPSSKARVFRIVRDLRLGRLSAEAGMELDRRRAAQPRPPAPDPAADPDGGSPLRIVEPPLPLRPGRPRPRGLHARRRDPQRPPQLDPLGRRGRDDRRPRPAAQRLRQDGQPQRRHPGRQPDRPAAADRPPPPARRGRISPSRPTSRTARSSTPTATSSRSS